MEQKAIELYEKIHQEHPENIECLQCMVTVLKGTGQNYVHYSNLLNKLLRDKEMNDPLPPQEAPPVYQQPAPINTEVNPRPGTSRKGRVVQQSKAQDAVQWPDNEELMLP